jgi:hypothetical protein
MHYSFLEPVPTPDGCEDDPVGVIEIAERLGVQDRSVHMMRRRGVLPAPHYDQINGSRAWEWRTVLWWAGETGRLRSRKLKAEYRSTFDLEPPIVVKGHPDPDKVITRPPRRKKKAATK